MPGRDGLGFNRPLAKGVEKGAQSKEVMTKFCNISSMVIGTHIQKYIHIFEKYIYESSKAKQGVPNHNIYLTG